MTQSYFHPKALIESDVVGEGTKVWAFAHIMPGSKIGKDCNICNHVYIEGGSFLGDRVTLKNGVSVWDGVTLEDDVFIGPGVAFTNDMWPKSRNANFELKKTLVKKGASIGANATLLCGITIGEGVMIGAGSVVTKSVPDHAVVYGNPAQVQRIHERDS